MPGHPAVRDALERVEASLPSPPTLTELAAQTGYSPAHLHKLVRHTVGMTIHEYAVRRRLTAAAQRLVSSDARVVDIAVTSGYGSQQAFTTAFRAAYKHPPGAYRRHGRHYALQHPFDFVGPPASALDSIAWTVDLARLADLPEWLALARAAVDMLPVLDEEDHTRAITAAITERRALLMRAGDGFPVGAVVVAAGLPHLDVMMVHPLVRRAGGVARLVDVAHEVVGRHRSLSVTTYRAGDRADTGHRAALLRAGFVPAQELVELGYPTQRMCLPGEAHA